MSESNVDGVVRISATMESAADVIAGLAKGADADKVCQIALSGKASEATLEGISGALCALQKANDKVKVGLDFGEVAWHEQYFDCYFDTLSNLVSIVFPKTTKYVSNDAFDLCAALETVVFLEGMESIGCEVFGYCKKLKSVQLPASLEEINDCAFMSCESLETVFYGGTKADWQRLAPNIDYLNEYLLDAKIVCCDGVFEATKDLVVPESPDESVIEYEGYRNHVEAKTIEIRDGVIEIGKDAFDGCLNAQSAKIPASVRVIRDGAFPFCPKLKTVFFGGTQAQWLSFCLADDFEDTTLLGAQTFCADGVFEAKVEIEAPFEQGEAKIKDCEFCNRIDIKSAKIREGTTEIERCAFYRCFNLDVLWLPASVTKIGSDAFDLCLGLKEVRWGGTRSQWKRLVESEGFERGNDALLSAKVICSDGEY